VRRAARVDATQPEIVDALRAAGATVWFIQVPVDLLVGFRGKTMLIECKSKAGKRAPKPKAHTPLQRDFMATWNGGPVATVCDVEGALRALEVMK
jgi:hypothetical protein